MTPKPVRRDPGSSPRTRTFAAAAITGTADSGAASGSNARQDLVRYLDIRIDALYVVQVFQGFDQTDHLLAGVAGKPR